ncbi:MAG TPA: DUF885 domain-containing protein [Terriglobales bacterium]|nr:DUF885 domain-containing protein [Terriglobales bacterium]
MMKLRSVVICVCLLFLTSALQARKVSKESNQAIGSNPDFSKAADQFMKASLVLSPVNASQAGFHKYTDPKTGKTIELDALLDDLGPKGVEAQRNFYTQWQKRFRQFNRASLNKEDNADWQLIDDQIAYNLLELDRIQSYRHNPTMYVEFIGNALFLPMSQNYAVADVRMGHVLARIGEIPRALQQAKQVLVDTDPIYTSTAVDENEGNIDLIEHTVKEQIPAGSALEKQYQLVAPPAVQALKEFSEWLQNDLAKRPTNRTWRLGKEFYDAKFKLVMETPVTPEEILQKAEQQMTAVRAEMLTLAEPMHKQMYPDHTEHNDLPATERQNLIISEVLAKISDDHVQRDQLMDHIKGDLAGITQFIREKNIVGLSDRDNLKVVATPLFLRGIYSVAGFHNPPPLEPTAEAQYWVTPIDKSVSDKMAESKLREYNNYALKWLTIHEALPGHYIQFEHADNVQPETRRLLRALFGNGAYIEGWAEYIAQVMMDEGFLNNDPKFRMVMRKIRLRVLSNTILDVRMQTMNMTDQQAMDLMTKQAFQTQAEAEGKLRRAKLSSVQLPTYFVGLNDWLQLRKDYQAKMGPNFQLAEFHNKALDEGPLPIMLLRGIIMPH